MRSLCGAEIADTYSAQRTLPLTHLAMSDGFTVGQVTQAGAWGLVLGTIFFAFFGIRAERVSVVTLRALVCASRRFQCDAVARVGLPH